MPLPVLAVVGRPNVGKSTLFNKLIGKRLSIVEDTPGVTRDRIYSKCEWRGREFMIVDTGGIEPKTDDLILSRMKQQAQLAIESADVIVLVTDVRCGVTANDYDVAAMLQKSGKPLILAVNKCDEIGDTPMEVYEFYNLGIGEPFPISSTHGHGTGDLLDEVFKYFPEDKTEDYEEDCIKVAVIGKPNVGKSSLLNALLREKKAIVTDIAGTTRDIVEGRISVGGIILNLIDTAGVRETEDIVEKIGVEKSKEVIKKAELILLLLDNSEKLSETDYELLELTKDKPRLVIINKSDLPKKIESIDGALEVSMKDENDVEKVEIAIRNCAICSEINDLDASYIGNSRQITLIQKALNHIEEALNSIEYMMPVDIINVDITKAYLRLGEVIGSGNPEDIINNLFANFCLGK